MTTHEHSEYVPGAKRGETHLRHPQGGIHTLCGRGGIAFSQPITNVPGEVTCKNCRKVFDAIQRDRGVQ
jgi:hypothetical protein